LNDLFGEKDEELEAAEEKIRELEKAAQLASMCTDMPPELASVINYLYKHNSTNFYNIGTNSWFLWNIFTNKVPTNSASWHPQTFRDWCYA
jgi:hypothetical protein